MANNDAFFSNLDLSKLGFQQKLDLTPKTESYVDAEGETRTRTLGNSPAGYNVSYNDSDAGRFVSGYDSPYVNSDGMNVKAYYDANGNLQYVSGDALRDLGGANRLSAQWDASGKATPVSWQQSAGGGGLLGAFKDIASSPLGQVGAAYFLPGLGEALAAQFGVSSAVGSALASTALQTASGVPFETALKNATVNAMVNTGSQDIAKDINASIQDPKVTNAITSVGASVVKTAALGGSTDDILKNATAALAGSGTASLTGDKAIGSAVGGYVTGGTTGAAIGAAGALGGDTTKTTPLKVDISGYTEIPVNDMQAGTQVAGPGGFEDFKPGLNQTKMGTFFTGFNSQGSLNTVPVIIDSKTGQIVSATGSAEDLGFLRQQNVSVLRVDPSKINPIYLDKSPINPNITPEEFAALKNVTTSTEAPTPEAEFATKYPDLAKLLKTYGSLDVAETAIGLDALMKIDGVKEAMNAGFIKDLEAGLAKDPTYAPYLEEYKKLTGKDYVAPTTEVPEVVITAPRPTTPEYTPTITSPDAAVTTPTPAPTTTTPTTSPVDTLVTTPTPTPEPAVTPTPTPTTTATTTPEPSRDRRILDLITPVSTTGPTSSTDSSVTPPAPPAPPGTPPAPPTGSPSTPPPDVPPVAAAPTAEPPKATKPKTTTPEFISSVPEPSPTTNTPAPVSEATSKSTYNPELFIYGGKYPAALSRALGTDLQAGGTPTPTTGLTTERGAGEIDAEGGINRKNVWNEESLRLKDALGL